MTAQIESAILLAEQSFDTNNSEMAENNNEAVGLDT